jgi:hypothetical protein
MTSRVYAIGLQGLEPPVPPAALAAGASREERASYRESMFRHREQVREFCNSRAAELTGTDRPPLRSYLHTAQDGTPQLRLSVFETGSDAAAALEKAGAELLYTEDPEPSVDGQTLRIPATFQHQTVGQGLTPEQIRDDGISRKRLAGAIRRQAPGVPREAGEQVRWMTATRDETNGTLLITWSRNPGPQPTAQDGGRGLPALTVGELMALLEQLPPHLPVWAEGCDCVNEVKGAGIYRHGPDNEEGPQCILVADIDYYGVLGPTLTERNATRRRVREQARQEESK